MENVTLTQKEQARLQVLNSLLAEHMTLDQAVTLMGVSERHTRRILAAYREEGAAAVAHGHRGRKAPNATPDAVVTSVVSLARTKYAGATHLSELLSEREGLDMGRTTLRRILVNAGLSSPYPPLHTDTALASRPKEVSTASTSSGRNSRAKSSAGKSRASSSQRPKAGPPYHLPSTQ